MTGGDALWALTTGTLLALDQSLIELRLFTGDDLQGDGTFVGGGDISTSLAVISLDGLIGLDPLDSRIIGNYGGAISATNSSGVEWSIGSFAVVRNDETLADAMLFYWNMNNPISVPDEDIFQIATDQLAFHLV